MSEGIKDEIFKCCLSHFQMKHEQQQEEEEEGEAAEERKKDTFSFAVLCCAALDKLSTIATL